MTAPIWLVGLVAASGGAAAPSGDADSRRDGGARRVSISSVGAEANRGTDGLDPAISARGRFVAFGSRSSNLVAGDSNFRSDVFVRDRQERTTERVSVGPGGAETSKPSWDPAISATGRYVAFVSEASRLVADDTNQLSDVFVHDRLTDGTRRVSIATKETQADGVSWDPAISADGRYLAFVSSASNLIPGGSTGVNVFLHDTLARVTKLVSWGWQGALADGDSLDPAISADGRFVTFGSDATNIAPYDTNDSYDVFVRNLSSHMTRRVSVGSGGRQANGFSNGPAISADGRYVTFYSGATNLDSSRSDGVFVRDRRRQKTKLVSVGQRGGPGACCSYDPTISGDGRYVAFDSSAGDLVRNDNNRSFDVFVRDRLLRVTVRVSVGPGGAEADDHSGTSNRRVNGAPQLCASGRYVAFGSLAQNLVGGDTNGRRDVFVAATHR